MFTQFLLASIISLYFFRLKNKSYPTRLLTWFFALMCLTMLCSVLAYSLLHMMTMWSIPPQYLIFLVAMIFMIQFAYAFPSPLPRYRTESRILLILSILAAVFAVVLHYFNTSNLLQGKPIRLPLIFIITVIIAFELAWATFVFLRRTLQLAPRSPNRSFFRHLLKPVKPEPRATRAFAILMMVLLSSNALIFLGEVGLITYTITIFFVPLGLLLFYFLFALIYINHTPKPASFQVKLVGASLVTVLFLLGVVGYLLFPQRDASYHYHDRISQDRSALFQPRSGSEGYDIASIPSRFDDTFESHSQLYPAPAGKRINPLKSNFPFPFASGKWDTFFIHKSGTITFGNPYDGWSFWGGYQKGISPMWLTWTKYKLQKVFYLSEPDSITITWICHSMDKSLENISRQLVLNKDGSILFNYRNIELVRPGIAGLFGGTGLGSIEEIRFGKDLPYSSKSTSVMENFHRHYRDYIHQQFFPLLLMVVFASLLILIVFPLFFGKTLVKPLKRLLSGVKQVENGNLSVSVPHSYNDEIGSLTSSFNRMVKSLNQSEQGRKEADKVKDNLLALNEAILNGAAEGVLTVDPEGIILSFNKSAEEMYQTNIKDVVGKPCHFLLEQEDTVIPKGFLYYYHESGNRKRFGVDNRFNGIRPDGSVFPLEFSVSPVDTANRHIFTIMLHDLTEHRKLADEKMKLEDQLHQAQKLETIGTLAGGVAHDFNNILTPIIGYAEMALEDTPDDSIVHEYTDNILKASIRARDLVRQILTFGRKTDINFQIVDIAPVIENIVEFLRASIPSTISFNIEAASDCGTVFGDRTQIEQVVINLCTNASQAMQPEGGSLSIKLESATFDENAKTIHPALKQEQYFMLQIADTGKGMNKETMDHIFEPFYTTKQVGDGTGLGLSVVHGIVDRHGGVILVESEPGQGSRFTVYFPSLSKTDIQFAMEDTRQEIHTGTESVLLVDDEAMVAALYKDFLQHAGYKVTTETSSIKTLEIFRAQPGAYDILITDNTMPNMTGLQLAREILNIRPDIPIIICSGNNETIPSETCTQLGIQKILSKPIFLGTLNRTIRELLG